MIDCGGYLGGDQRLYRRIDDHRHYTLMGCICMYDECSPEYPNTPSQKKQSMLLLNCESPGILRAFSSFAVVMRNIASDTMPQRQATPFCSKNISTACSYNSRLSRFPTTGVVYGTDDDYSTVTIKSRLMKYHLFLQQWASQLPE
jgi:hypothetical protein